MVLKNISSQFWWLSHNLTRTTKLEKTLNKEKERTFKILSCPFLISPSKLRSCQDLSFSLSVLNLEKDVSNLPLRSCSIKQNMSPNEHLKICLKLIFQIKREILIIFYFIAYVSCVGLHVKTCSSYSSVLLWLPGSRKITCIGWWLTIYSMSYYTSVFPSNLTLKPPVCSLCCYGSVTQSKQKNEMIPCL